MKTKSVLLTLLLLVRFAHAAGPLDWLKPDALDPEKTARIKDELGLTQEQESKIGTVLSEARATMADLSGKIQQEKQAFEILMRNPATPPDDGVKAMRNLIEAEAAVKERQLRAILAIRDLLTPEQQKKAISSRTGKGDPMAVTPFAEKAARVKAAVDALGVPPTDALKEVGAAIESLVGEGKLAEAEATLDKFILESKADEPDDGTDPDFGAEETGATDTGTLQRRRDDVIAKAQRVISLPLLRKLVKAKTALETAVSNQDADAAGRVLTWLEKQLSQP